MRTTTHADGFLFTPARAGLPRGETGVLLGSGIAPKSIAVRAFARRPNCFESDSEGKNFLESDLEQLFS